MMHLIIHMFYTSVVPYISFDMYLNSNLYTIQICKYALLLLFSIYIEASEGMNEKLLICVSSEFLH